MKERLIKLIQTSVGGCARNWAEVIADSIIKDGWTRPSYKLGQTVYVVDKNDTVWWEAKTEAFYRTERNTYYLVRFKDGIRGAYSLDEIYPTKEEADRALKGEPNDND